MEKAYACGTHGKPCVNMHGTFEGYIYGSSNSVYRGSSKKKEEEGKREREEKKRKGKKKREELKKKEERKMNESRTMSRPRRKRTRNCATRGKFSPTLVILRLRVM